nr:zinc finger protein [Hymenolepis microstoma]
MELPKFLYHTFLSPLVISTHFSSYSSSYSSSTSYFFRSLQINFTFPNYLFNLPQSHCRSLPPILSFSAQAYQPHAPILKLTQQTSTTLRQTQPSPPKMLLSHPLLHKPTGHSTYVHHHHKPSRPKLSWPTSNAITSSASSPLPFSSSPNSQHTSLPQQDASPHPTLTTTINSSTFTHISAHPPTPPPPPPHSSLPPPNQPTRFLSLRRKHIYPLPLSTLAKPSNTPLALPLGSTHCPSCHKTFSRPSLLARHLRVHLGDKPFDCQYCPTSFSTLTSSYFIPSPPQSSLPHPPPSPTPLPLPHCRTDADADGATTAMACSSLLTANPNLNYMTSTLKTIKPNYTSATTIPLLIHFSHGPFHHASHHQHHYHPAHNFPQLHSRMYPHCSPPTP